MNDPQPSLTREDRKTLLRSVGAFWVRYAFLFCITLLIDLGALPHPLSLNPQRKTQGLLHNERREGGKEEGKSPSNSEVIGGWEPATLSNSPYKFFISRQLHLCQVFPRIYHSSEAQTAALNSTQM